MNTTTAIKPIKPTTIASNQTRNMKIMKAECDLLNRALLSVSPKAYAEFLARLNAPAKPNARLRRTMKAVAPWLKANDL